MSLYIHPENQNLLWNIISKNSMIQQYFSRFPQGAKEQWFKQIIASFYQQNEHILVTNEQLYEINKNTIQYMIKDVKRNIDYQESQLRPQNRVPEPTMNQTDFLKSYSVTENREDKMAAQYNQYQQNYMSMFDKKVPESIDFRENIKESAINNMDELIKRHMQERDEELKKYAPPPLFSLSDTGETNDGGQRSKPYAENAPIQQSNNQPNNRPNRITINDNSDPVQFSIEELAPNPRISQKLSETRDQETNYKKEEKTSIKWMDNENSNKIDDLRKDFQEFQIKILDMFDKILDRDREPMYIGNVYSFSDKNI